jgi:chorismate mutase
MKEWDDCDVKIELLEKRAAAIQSERRALEMVARQLLEDMAIIKEAAEHARENHGALFERQIKENERLRNLTTDIVAHEKDVEARIDAAWLRLRQGEEDLEARCVQQMTFNMAEQVDNRRSRQFVEAE